MITGLETKLILFRYVGLIDHVSAAIEIYLSDKNTGIPIPDSQCKYLYATKNSESHNWLREFVSCQSMFFIGFVDAHKEYFLDKSGKFRRVSLTKELMGLDIQFVTDVLAIPLRTDFEEKKFGQRRWYQQFLQILADHDIHICDPYNKVLKPKQTITPLFDIDELQQFHRVFSFIQQSNTTDNCIINLTNVTKMDAEMMGTVFNRVVVSENNNCYRLLPNIELRTSIAENVYFCRKEIYKLQGYLEQIYPTDMVRPIIARIVRNHTL